MYKTTSKFMQAGRGRDVPRAKPVIRHPRARATEDELREFNTGETTLDDLLDQLRPVVKRLRVAKGVSPGQLAKLLNAEGWTTAQGRRWNERRVILLLRFLAEQASRRRRVNVVASDTFAGNRRTPLTQEEVARRLSALGRIKG